MVGVNFPLSVTSAQATRIRIDSSRGAPNYANAGVGLYASDVQKWSFAHYSTDSGVSYDFTIYNDALTSSAILVKGSNSNVLIGTTTDAGYKLDVNGTIRGSSFTKTGGTSSQFLKADGSVDSNTYLTTGTAASTYVPYSGATGNVNLGTYILSALNLIANGNTNSGALLLKNANAASLIDTGYFKFSPSSSSTEISFGFSTGASTWKQFSFSSHLITNNTITIFSLPNGGGTLAVTTDLGAYLPLAGGTLTGALSGTSASFTGKLSVTQASTDFVAEITNTQNANPYGLRIKDAASGANNYPLLSVSNNAGSVEYFRVNSGTGAASFSSSVTATQFYWGGTVNNNLSAGSISIVDSGTGTKYLQLSVSNTVANIATNYTNSNIPLTLNSYGNTNQLYLSTSGNVLIGTATDVGSKLYVNGDIRTSAIFYGVDSGPSIYQNRINAGWNSIGDNIDLWINYEGYLNSTSYFRDFRVGNGKQGAAILFIDGSAGTSTFSGGVTIQGGNSLVVNNASNTRSGYLQTSPTGTELSSFAGAGEPLILIAPDTTANIRFYTGGSTVANERMRITSGGVSVFGHTSAVGTIFSPPIQVKGGAGTGNGFGIISGNNEMVGGLQLSSSGSNSLQITVDPDNLRASSELTIQIDGSQRMSITSGGKVQIGSTSLAGDDLFNVTNSSSTGYGASIQGGSGSGNYSFTVRNYLGTTYFYVRGDGLIQTGTASASPYNNTSGAAANMVVTSGGTLERSTSSLKYKTDIVNYDKGLAEVLRMRPVYYKSINEREKDLTFAGLIAEEIEELGLTEFVQYAEDGTPDALAYSNMVALLVKGIQELKAELDELKK